MKGFKSIIRKKEITKAIVYLLLVGAFVFVGISSEISFKDLFTPYYTITNLNQLVKYQDHNSYVTIKTKTIYTTNYSYFIDEKEVAAFLDIDVDGLSLIAIVPMKEAKALLEDQNGLKEIKGKLKPFTDKEYTGALNKIKEQYIEDFKEDMTEEEVLNTFVPVQLDAYTGKKSEDIFPALVITIPGITFFILAIIAIVKGINPNLHKILKKSKYLNQEAEIDVLDAEREYLSKEYIYSNKNLIITNKYIIHKSIMSFNVEKIENICWMYQRIMKQYGLIEVNRYMEIRYLNNKQWSVPSKESENEKIFSVLLEKKPDIDLGYTKELIDKWRKRK